MFVVNIRYKVEIDKIDQFVVEHRKWLDELYNENKLLCSGPKNPRDGGIVIALIKDLQEVKALFAKDPFYTNKLADYEFIEFNPNKFHKLVRELA